MDEQARPEAHMKDVIIIGSGPAGLCAAIYCARAGLKTLVFGIPKNSNAYKAHVFENYMGFEERISGPFLIESSRKQAMKFGAEHIEREIVDVKKNDDGTFTVTDSELNLYYSKTLIICSGLGFKPSGIKNEAALTGRGISFCATCDGPFFKNKPIAVIGNTNFAGEEALLLHGFTPHITILSHGKDFAFTPIMQSGLVINHIMPVKSPRITEFTNSSPEGRNVKIKFSDNTEQEFGGVFVALGNATAADFANQLGLARTGPQNAFLVADLRTGTTNVHGVYAAGDCLGGNAQAAKSAGEGCNAAISVVKLLKGVAAYVDYS